MMVILAILVLIVTCPLWETLGPVTAKEIAEWLLFVWKLPGDVIKEIKNQNTNK